MKIYQLILMDLSLVAINLVEISNNIILMILLLLKILKSMDVKLMVKYN